MAAMEEAVVTSKELSSSCFYSLSFDVSVHASEDLATADKLFTGALYTTPFPISTQCQPFIPEYLGTIEAGRGGSSE